MSRAYRADLDRLLNQVSTSTYRDQNRVKKDIQTCIGFFANLKPSVDTHWNIDGSSVKLILLDGTVPMNYAGQNYHIPVEIFLMVNYPSSPPQVYVKPTPDMQIAHQHRNVDKSGLVYMPYLSRWMSNNNLYDLCRELTRMFSESPPVYAKQKNTTPTVNVASSSQVQPIKIQPPPSYNVSNTNTYPNNNNYTPTPYNNTNSYSTVGQNTPHYTTPYSHGNGSSINNGMKEKEKKEDLKKKLKVKLQTHINHLYDRIRSELSTELLKQVRLERNTTDLKKNIEEMNELKKQLNESIIMLKQKNEEVDKWCAEQKDKEEIPVSDMIVPLDMYSKQMVDLVSNKVAIEDALYSLDRAFENNKIDMSDFMKEVRKLAKDEFMIVALKNKVVQTSATLSPKYGSQQDSSQPFMNGGSINSYTTSSGVPGATLRYNDPPPSYSNIPNSSNFK